MHRATLQAPGRADQSVQRLPAEARFVDELERLVGDEVAPIIARAPGGVGSILLTRASGANACARAARRDWVARACCPASVHHVLYPMVHAPLVEHRVPLRVGRCTRTRKRQRLRSSPHERDCARGTASFARACPTAVPLRKGKAAERGPCAQHGMALACDAESIGGRACVVIGGGGRG